MIDPLAASIDGIVRHNYAIVPIIFLAGLVTSIGPCVAPRYLALASLVSRRGVILTVAAFTAGIVTAYVVLGLGAGFVAALLAHTRIVDVVMAVVLVGFGMYTLLREPHECDDEHAIPAPRRASGAFTLGAASALVISPCCTPVIAAIAGLSAFDRDPWFAAIALAAFAVGHAAPLTVAGALGASFADRLRFVASTSAPAMISGTLTIALGCYYGLIA